MKRFLRSTGFAGLVACAIAAVVPAPARAAITGVSVVSVSPTGTVKCPVTLSVAVQAQGTPNEPFIWIGVYSLGGGMGNTGMMPVNGKIGPSGTTSFHFALPIAASAVGSDSWVQINTQTSDTQTNFNSTEYPLNISCESASALAQPLNLHPLESNADCSKYGVPAAECQNAFQSGHLVLGWDEPASATGYDLLRTDAPSLNPWSVTHSQYADLPQIPPGSGFSHQCFAVTAQTASGASPQSGKYCYADGAVATTKVFSPIGSATAVQSYFPRTSPGCDDKNVFSTMDRLYGDAFTEWLAPLATGQGGGPDYQFVRPGIYAGAEQALYANLPSCGAKAVVGSGTSTAPNAYTQAIALATGAVSFDLSSLASHHIASATLQLTKSASIAFSPSPASGFPGGEFLSGVGGGGPLQTCSFPVGFEPAPPGTNVQTGGFTNTPIAGAVVNGNLGATSAVDVTSALSAAGAARATFVLRGQTLGFSPPYNAQVGGCLAEFVAPQLSVSYF